MALINMQLLSVMPKLDTVMHNINVIHMIAYYRYSQYIISQYHSTVCFKLRIHIYKEYQVHTLPSSWHSNNIIIIPVCIHEQHSLLLGKAIIQHIMIATNYKCQSAISTVSVKPSSVTPPIIISRLSGRTAVRQSYRPVVM